MRDSALGMIRCVGGTISNVGDGDGYASRIGDDGGDSRSQFILGATGASQPPVSISSSLFSSGSGEPLLM